MLSNNEDEIKRRRCDRNINKNMRVPVDIHKTNKMFTVTV